MGDFALLAACVTSSIRVHRGLVLSCAEEAMTDFLDQIHPATPLVLAHPEALTDEELSAIGGGAVDNPGQTPM
jgi:hypothetical protein